MAAAAGASSMMLAARFLTGGPLRNTPTAFLLARSSLQARPLITIACSPPPSTSCPSSSSSSSSSSSPSWRRLQAPWGQQVRTKIVIPEKKLIKKTSRSSGPGGQSVNVSDTRVQLSFKMDEADWLPVPIREKMKEIFKNRVSKTGEFGVACQVADSQLTNTKLAVQMIYDHISKAEKAVQQDEIDANKIDRKEYILEKMKADGREKEIEKKQEAIKNVKSRTRERTRNKKIEWY